jgi:uncharacterized protein YdeI (YjbR/CyaY-like superfamily)
MPGPGDFEQREFRSRQALRRWLEANHDSAETFWLVTYKKHVADGYIAYDDIVGELLCFGWIDTRTRRLDDERTMLLVAPRRPGSSWSAANRKRVAKLLREGHMSPAGQAAIDAARKDGSWNFLDDVEKLIVPGDLAAAFAGNPEARRNYEAFNAAAKKVILLWIKTAKRAETRRRRITETVRLAAMNVKAAHPEARDR